MHKGHESSSDDDLELSLETLDQWETELDQFAAGIMQRLSQITGKAIDTSGILPDSQRQGQHHHDDVDDPEAMQLLQTLRDMTQ